MFRFLKIYGFLLIAGLFILGCTNTENSGRIVVAEVGENKLYNDDLSKIIPNELDQNDSSIMAQDYITKWIKQELLIQKANENLTPEQKNLTREIQEYRNSIIIYKYKNELMKQRMDTTITQEQITQFYDANPENFNLNKNIVKAIFIKIPNEVSNPEFLKDLVENSTEEGLSELREYCLQYAKGFDIFIDNWIDFETVKNNIPQEIENAERFLTGNNQIELKDSNYYYLVSIKDFKLINDLAPLQYVENNIKNLLLNKRKIEFLKKIEENIYTEGIRKNKFKIHYKETENTNR